MSDHCGCYVSDDDPTPAANDKCKYPALLAERDALRKAILEHAPMWDEKTCCFCGSLWSLTEHDPDCIVRKLGGK